MDIRRSAFAFAMIGISVIAAYFLFRRNPRERLVSRGPTFVVLFLMFFYIGVTELPFAVPGVFDSVLGHSVYVVRDDGTWWLVRWLEPIRTGYFYVLLAGMIWAVVNLARRRAWKANAACVALGALVWLAHIWLSVTCFPFCF